MSEALPDGPAVPESEARPPVNLPVQGTAPAWEPIEENALASSTKQNPADRPETPGEVPVERADRGAMTGTAERIGSVVGTAQRQWRRGLELVRRPAFRPMPDIDADAEADAAGSELGQEVSRLIDSQMLKEIEEEVTKARRQAARQLDEWSDIAGQRLQQFRYNAQTALANSRLRAREIANAYPLQTIAGIAGVSFALGVALRFRRSHRG